MRRRFVLFAVPILFLVSMGAGTMTARGATTDALLNVLEGVVVRDAIGTTPSALLNVGEHVNVADLEQFMPSVLLNVGEHVNEADVSRFFPSALLNDAEHVAVADVETFVPSKLLNVDEHVVEIDFQHFVPSALLNVAEHVSEADTSGFRPSVLLVVHEGVHEKDILPDTTAPTVTITSAPPNPTNSKQATFQFKITDSDNTSGFFSACSLDGGAFTQCTSGVTYQGLSDGSHTFKVHASDPAGNRSQDASFTWRVDTDALSVALTGIPPNPSKATSGTITFIVGDPDGDDAASTLVTTCKLDAGSFAPCASPFAYSGLADGNHTISVRESDPAGNSTTLSYTWRIDTDAPVAAISTKPGNPSRLASGSIGFTVTDTDGDDDPAFLVAFCKLDAGAFAPCTSPFTYSSLADGTHTFSVHATDPAGNVGSDATYTWRIDTDAPKVVITSGAPNPSFVSSATFTFTGSDSDGDDATSTLTFTCALDGGAAVACASPVTYKNLLPGSHSFTVTVFDPAGNSSSASARWTFVAKILFTSAQPPPASVYSVNPDGTNLTRLTNTGVSTSPSWSPDFSRIVFSSNRDGRPSLYVMNADGTNVTRITNAMAADFTPSWSTDGSFIAFSRAGDTGSQIWIVKPDGTGAVAVTQPGGLDTTPSWSPDGKRIVFSSVRGGTVAQLWLVNVDGTGLTQFTSGTAANTTPAWSPDGQWIAFSGTASGAAQIYKIHPDGTGLVRLTTSTGQDVGPAWSADGSQIVFISDRAGPPQLYVMSSADGSGVTRVTPGAMGVDATPDW